MGSGGSSPEPSCNSADDEEELDTVTTEISGDSKSASADVSR